ncbi:MAG: ABC transporter transmembrane domain-containing protein, partial [Acidobacteria bacterium]|nr:ABC transporter transmembrane domain-containing protein [Acidobacteriota bacterium]
MSPLARLVPYVLRYRRQFLLGLACLVLTTAFSLLGPWVLRHAVDDLTAGVTRDKLAVHAATLLGLAMAGGVFRFLMRRILVGASRAIEYDLRNAFVAHLQRLPLAWFHATRTGDLMSRATNDLNAVRMMVGPAIMYMASTGLVFVVSIALMLSIDPVLTLAALACLPPVSVAVKFFGSAVYRQTERIQAQLSTLSAVVQEGLAGVRVVRAYCREGVEAERFGRENREYLARNARLIRTQALFYPSLGFILGLAGVLVLWLGARHVIEGRITVGQFVAFNAYLLMLSWPMIAFGFVTNLFQRGMAAWGRMCEGFDAPPAAPARPHARPRAPRPGPRGGEPRRLGRGRVEDLAYPPPRRHPPLEQVGDEPERDHRPA